MSNEAAERLLLKWLNHVTYVRAAERIATVERIRAAIQAEERKYKVGSPQMFEVYAILDAEAAK